MELRASNSIVRSKLKKIAPITLPEHTFESSPNPILRLTQVYFNIPTSIFCALLVYLISGFSVELFKTITICSVYIILWNILTPIGERYMNRNWVYIIENRTVIVISQSTGCVIDVLSSTEHIFIQVHKHYWSITSYFSWGEITIKFYDDDNHLWRCSLGIYSNADEVFETLCNVIQRKQKSDTIISMENINNL